MDTSGRGRAAAREIARDGDGRRGGDAPVGVADLLGVHAAGEEEDEGGDAHEEEAGREVGVHAHVGVGGVYLRQELVEDPLVRDAEEVRLQQELTQQEGDDDEQLEEEHCTFTFTGREGNGHEAG